MFNYNSTLTHVLDSFFVDLNSIVQILTEEVDPAQLLVSHCLRTQLQCILEVLHCLHSQQYTHLDVIIIRGS